jgi:asparagine synthase (glutamine-hydrolysing)
MVAAYAWRTAQTVGYARSQRSNHLISEAVGLWTAGTLYPELKGAQAWQQLGAELLCEAVLDQISAEGVSHQHSFNYQRMILQLLLWTLRLSEIHGVPLHEEIRARARSGYDFMRQWVDPSSGLVPNYGSDDGSLIFPLANASYRDFRPLLQLGAACLGRDALKSGTWDEAALWFGLNPDRRKETDSISSVIANTGYFRLGDENSWALIRAGKYVRRPFQADQLHVDLWWKGINLAHDPGTYLYNGAAPWNNGFARTVVHNTVTVDHEDQMRRAGRFLWVDWAQASGRTYSSRGQLRPDRFEGEHDGYKRLGVTHRRTVPWLADFGWVIVDDVDGAGQHHVQLHWLAADLPFEVIDSPFQVAFKSGESRIGWNIFSSAPGLRRVIRTGEQMEPFAAEPKDANPDTLLLGWRSPTYGELQPAVSMVYEAHSQLPVRFVTVILTSENCKLELRGGEVVLSENRLSISSKDSEIYRVRLLRGAQQTA